MLDTNVLASYSQLLCLILSEESFGLETIILLLLVLYETATNFIEELWNIIQSVNYGCINYFTK